MSPPPEASGVHKPSTTRQRRATTAVTGNSSREQALGTRFIREATDDSLADNVLAHYPMIESIAAAVESAKTEAMVRRRVGKAHEAIVAPEEAPVDGCDAKPVDSAGLLWLR
jgi:hypothetical protein